MSLSCGRSGSSLLPHLTLAVAALLARGARACPNDRPDIVCVQGAGIDGAPLPLLGARTIGNKWVELKLTVSSDVRIRDLDLLLQIDHGLNGDMTIKLQSPIGVTQTLCDRCFGGSDLVQTILDDEADKAIGDEGVAAPYTGSFRSKDGTLAAWDGTNARGVWTLAVHDYGGNTLGHVEQWELHITPATFCEPPLFQNAVADGQGGETTSCVSSCPGVVLGQIFTACACSLLW